MVHHHTEPTAAARRAAPLRPCAPSGLLVWRCRAAQSFRPLVPTAWPVVPPTAPARVPLTRPVDSDAGPARPGPDSGIPRRIDRGLAPRPAV